MLQKPIWYLFIELFYTIMFWNNKFVTFQFIVIIKYSDCFIVNILFIFVCRKGNLDINMSEVLAEPLLHETIIQENIEQVLQPDHHGFNNSHPLER